MLPPLRDVPSALVLEQVDPGEAKETSHHFKDLILHLATHGRGEKSGTFVSPNGLSDIPVGGFDKHHRFVDFPKLLPPQRGRAPHLQTDVTRHTCG